MIAAVFLLAWAQQEGGPDGPNRDNPPSAVRDDAFYWSFGRPLAFHNVTIFAAFFWVPPITLDKSETWPTLGGCPERIDYLDKEFYAQGILASIDLGPLEIDAGIYFGGVEGRVERTDLCNGRSDIYSYGGDVVAFEFTMLVPTIYFAFDAFRLRVGPAAGVLWMFEMVDDEYEPVLFEYGVTAGLRLSLDYEVGKKFYFSVRIGGSWMFGGHALGWFPEVTVGVGCGI